MIVNIIDGESIAVLVNGKRLEQNRGILLARDEVKPIECTRLVTLEHGINTVPQDGVTHEAKMKAVNSFLCGSKA